MKTRDILAIFNRGRISKLALARTDVSRAALSAEIQTNYIPRTLGSMMLRPGFGYVADTPEDGALIPFVKANDDTAIIDLTPGLMRILADGTTPVTRTGVTAAVTNGFFATDLTGWADEDSGGAVSEWAAGRMQLTGTGYDSARRRQRVVVNEVNQEHSLRINIKRGPVVLRIGSAEGRDNVFRQAVLRDGWHSIAFTPNSQEFWIDVSTPKTYPCLIDSIEIEAAGVVEIPTPWASVDQCKLVRWQQSEDVVFCACRGVRPQRIERRPNNSWSVVVFRADDGPFLSDNTDNIRLTPSALTGEISVAASRDVFQVDHIGSLFRISSQGQKVEADLSAPLAFTNHIKVTGIDTKRVFKVRRSGTWNGILRLQRSIGEPGAWTNAGAFSTNGATDFDDELDNVTVYYRIGFPSGDYTSGTATASLEFAGGSIDGVVEVTSFTSETEIGAVVLQDLGDTDATEVWAEGAWNDIQGWPEVAGIWDGRMWLPGNGRNYASVPDAFSTFDPETVGDSAPINRRVGEGVSSRINWLLTLSRLVVGTDGEEQTVRSTSFDEPITPSNYNTRATSTRGSRSVPAVKMDGRGYFVGKTGTRLYELVYDPATYDYITNETTLLVPEIGDGEFVRVGVQQTPDLRVHAIRADGTVGLLIRDEAEDVMGWVDVETDGIVEDVCVLPGNVEDRVFYRVRREVGGAAVRYVEEWAREDEARGGAVNKIADSFKVGTGLITGMDHLEGKQVVVWADGKSKGTFPVTSGSVDISETPAEWCCGLGYRARYRSSKLAGQTQLGFALTQRKRINQAGLILADTHAQGLKYGPSFDLMDDLPLVEDGALVDPDTVWEEYDKDMIEFPGDWDVDSRFHMESEAPKPCTILAAVLNVDRQDKA